MPIDHLALQGRACQLRPYDEIDVAWLHELATRSELLFRWRLRGVPLSPQQLHAAVQHDSLASWMIIDRATGERAALYQCHNASLQNLRADVSVIAETEHMRSVTVGEGIALCIGNTFETWPFRKLYFEMPSFVVGASVEQPFGLDVLRMEGRLVEYVYLGGQWYDVFIYSLLRADAQEKLRLVLEGFGRDRFVLRQEPIADLLGTQPSTNAGLV